MAPPFRLLQDVLLAVAEAAPDRTAIVADGVRPTYREIAGYACRLARLLQARGIGRGDRVVIFMENNWQCAAAIFAVVLAGGVFVAVNAQTRHEKLAFVVRDSGARVLLSEARLERVFGAAAASMPGLQLLCVAGAGGSRPVRADVAEDGMAGLAGSPPARTAISLDLAALIYTSGTTGRPKGVMHTHQSLLFALESINEYLGIRSDDRLFSALPLSFGYGLFQWLSAVRAGACLVLERTFTYPAVAFNRMREEAATVFASVPTVYAMMLAQDAKQRLCFPGVRLVTSAAAALPPEFIDGIGRLFPDAALCKMYGQTECIRTAYLDPSLAGSKPESVGRAIPGTELILLNDRGLPVSPGEVGMLHVRGPHVMRGYWNRPEESAAALIPRDMPGDLLLRTGDLFRRDADGDLYFVSRSDDIIKSRGEKVNPAEVEAVVHGLPGVREAVVVGVPDAILGQAVCAFLCLHSGARLSEREVKRHCREHLENLMVPKHVVFVESLPLTENGKVSRKLLLEQHANRTEQASEISG